MTELERGYSQMALELSKEAIAAAAVAEAAEIKLKVTSNGSLVHDAPFVGWGPPRSSVTLDGDFTLDELRSIIRQIEAAMSAPS